MVTTSLRRVGGLLAQIWLPVLLLVLWYVLSAGSTSLYFPQLSEIFTAMRQGFTEGTLGTDVLVSLRNLAAGLVLATVAGTLLGLVIGELPRLRQVLDPLLQFVRAVPQVAIVPIVLGALGIGAAPKIYSIAFACFWPILLNTVDGVRGIDPAVRQMARAYRIPTLLRMRRVVFPGALPQIVAGVRVSLSIGVVVMVVSELFGALAGLGHFIDQAGKSFHVADAWAGTLLVGAIGYLLSALFLALEHRVLGWYFASAALVRRGARKQSSRLRKAVT
jgi:ABC-type nitrate/sulfonate/bicarbonate transport system permease component